MKTKYKQKYIESTENQKWKTVKDEQPVKSVKWDCGNEVFVCKLEGGDEYTCGWKDFYRKHVELSTKRSEYFDILKSDTNSENFEISTWMCFMNGFLHYLESLPEEIPLNKSVHINNKGLTDYIFDRTDDLCDSLSIDEAPDWLVNDIKNLVKCPDMMLYMIED